MTRFALSFNALLLTVLFAGMPSAQADGNTAAYMTLKGLKQIVLEVDGIRNDFSRYGLEAEKLKAVTSERLRSYGLNIVEQETAQGDANVGLIRIKLNANENQYSFYHYGIKLELRQKVPVSASGGYIAQTTWTTGRTGVLLPMDLNRINGYTADLVELFVKDHRAQNPGQMSAASVE